MNQTIKELLEKHGVDNLGAYQITKCTTGMIIYDSISDENHAYSEHDLELGIKVLARELERIKNLPIEDILEATK